MLVALVAIALLIASVTAIYLLLKSMAQDGVAVGAPKSCQSGSCGVRNGAATETSCHQEEAQLAEADEIKAASALEQQHAAAEQQSSRLG